MNTKEMFPLWNMDRFYYRWDDDKLRIGTDDSNTWEIDDPAGIWESLIKHCDGKSSVFKICQEMKSENNLPTDSTIDAIQQFINSLSVTMLSEALIDSNWKERYRTNIAFLTGEGSNGVDLQKKLENMHITILGLGGGGSTIFSQLVSLGIGNIHIVDDDTVELSNLNRQLLFSEDSIGKKKVDLGIEYAQKHNSNIKVTRSDKRMVTSSDVKNEIEGSDWVFCCMDEPAYIAQRIVNMAAQQLEIPVMYGFSQRQNGRIFVVMPGKGCVDCLLSKMAKNSFVTYVKALKNSSFVPSTAAISPSIGLLCSWMVKSWLDIVTKNKLTVANQILRFDFDTFKVTKVVSWGKDEHCPTCGDGKTSNVVKRLFELIPLPDSITERV